MKRHNKYIILTTLLISTTCVYSTATSGSVDKTTKTKKETTTTPREGKFAGYHQTSNDVYTSEVIENGSYLMLSDNSIWCVNPKDTIISGGWIAPAKVRIEKSSNPSYPYTLYNTLTQDKIQVKRSSLADIHKSNETERKSQQLKQKKRDDLINEEKEKKQELLK
jgi:hypothetical protein